MDKKKIIQIVFIIAAFGAAGVILYNGFFNNSASAPVVVSQTTVSNASSEKVLPYGSSLDFDGVLKEQKLQFGLLDYPKLDPNSEVGIPVAQLIIPVANTGAK